MKVQFTQEITIGALGRRCFAGEIIDVPADLVDMLVSGNFAVVIEDDSIVDDTPDDPAPTKRRGRKSADEAVG